MGMTSALRYGGARQLQQRRRRWRRRQLVARGFYITPTLSANATLTDNVNLSATDKQSDLILGISPGIQIGGQSGRVRGYPELRARRLVLCPRAAIRAPSTTP